MKHLPRLILAFVAGVVSYLGVTYLFDGEAMDWRKSLAQAMGVLPAVILVIFLARRKEEKD